MRSRQAGDFLLEMGERPGVLLRQPGANLADLAAELAEPLLHVGQSIAVAPVRIPDLACDPLQRVLQAGCGAGLGRLLAWLDDGLGLGLVGGRHGGSVGPESADRGTPRGRRSQRAIEAERSWASFVPAEACVRLGTRAPKSCPQGRNPP